MVVWIPYQESAARPKPAPTIASKSKVSGSINNPRMLNALNDQFEPSTSEDKSALYLHCPVSAAGNRYPSWPGTRCPWRART